jgi:hypothetical protein
LRSVDGPLDAPSVQRENIMKKIANDKLTNRKLKLDRQTISVLGTVQLADIAGGIPRNTGPKTDCTATGTTTV